MQVRRAYAANPEDRSMIGFLVGWFLLLVTFVGLIQILSVMWTRVPDCYTELGTYCDPETAAQIRKVETAAWAVGHGVPDEGGNQWQSVAIPETAAWARWASTPHLLPLVLDLYLCVCAFITCALELEINSRLLRDHMARPIEQSLAFLRVASGRGVFYCMTGLLAFDLRYTRWRATDDP